jgi:DNA helicase-2/ATP-dependent DNA helicase PcrA
MRRYLHPVREHRAAGRRGGDGQLPVLRARRILDALAPDPGSWEQAVQVVGLASARSRRALAATLGRLADAAQQTAAGQTAAGQTAAGQTAAGQTAAGQTQLDPLIRARYPDAAVRLTDLQRLADAAAAQPSLHDVLAELTLDPPVSASDLAGPPRLDEDYLTSSTIHAAKGLEWPIVHLLHLDGRRAPQ